MTNKRVSSPIERSLEAGPFHLAGAIFQILSSFYRDPTFVKRAEGAFTTLSQRASSRP